jgi:hypothetical protein
MLYNGLMSRENLGFLKCGQCGWIHFTVSRKSAEEEVARFNRYFDSLSVVDQESHYGGKKSSISSYEHCFRCGTSYEQAVVALDSEVPNGSTIQPLIAPDDYPSVTVKKSPK